MLYCAAAVDPDGGFSAWLLMFAWTGTTDNGLHTSAQCTLVLQSACPCMPHSFAIARFIGSSSCGTIRIRKPVGWGRAWLAPTCVLDALRPVLLLTLGLAVCCCGLHFGLNYVDGLQPQAVLCGLRGGVVWPAYVDQVSDQGYRCSGQAVRA